MKKFITGSYIVVVCLVMHGTILAQSIGDYRSHSSGEWNTTSTWERWDGATWITPAASAPTTTAGETKIRSGHIVSSTTGPNPQIDQFTIESGGSLNVYSGQALQIYDDGTGLVDMTIASGGVLRLIGNGDATVRSNATASVFGTIICGDQTGGTSLTNNGTIVIENGGTYQHNRNGGTIPNMTYAAGSLCEVTGMSTSLPGGLNRSFFHFTWNCPNQTVTGNLAGALRTINGDFTMTSTGSGRIRLTNSANQTLTVDGSYYHNGGILEISDGGDWTIDIAGDMALTGGTIFMLRDAGSANGNPLIDIAGNFTMSGSSTLDMSNYTGSNPNNGFGTMNVGGNFSQFGGTITESSSGVGKGFIVFNGPGNQTIETAGTLSGRIHFEVNKGLGSLTLASNVSLPANLILQSGILTLSSFNLTLSTTSLILGSPYSTSNMVDASGSGELRKRFSSTGSFFFPVGDQSAGTDYSPLTVNFTAGTFGSNAYVGVRVVDAKHPQLYNSTDFITRYWPVSSNDISGFVCEVDYYFIAADVVGTISNITSLLWIGAWDELGNMADVPNLHLFGTVNGFGDFTGGPTNPLPVELTSFSASYHSSVVDLKWRTVTEANNYGFDIQRALSADVWETIGFVPGNGTVNSPRNYSYTDLLTGHALQNREISYRLKQIDRNGALEYSPVVTVALAPMPRVASLQQNYPNPYNPTTSISFSLPQEERVTLVVYDLYGKEITRLIDASTLSAGNHTVSFTGTDLLSGMYLYQLQTAHVTLSRSMMLTK